MNEDKKQIPLRVSSKLYNAIAEWAEDDFRSINGQIGKNGKYVGEEIDIPPNLNFGDTSAKK